MCWFNLGMVSLLEILLCFLFNFTQCESSFLSADSEELQHILMQTSKVEMFLIELQPLFHEAGRARLNGALY